ncbi:MAG: hypothetical protein A2X87_05315 [Deltaproteobacteria bacterium GWC2_42_51]|nr:MAG: hypothetical protein A2056_05870 [Deltaproteobacteria bacterium GWA2_42_85]OGP28098.1 MAG: hypothetical protein A2067_08650 [Deltaproteobacteria bacterium GWB2_42_7]OGP36697.1 MAG: hypothetical protein A2X87_05315 [Deltaproteobacteria bacterium GWC2_42_51]OGP48758.1 MAG: hypothetical protein A2022_00185 [Deltaproteobacteria bacterium GWF2_42_12]OGQ27038.1 MAG: hypothetical protein A3D29_07965 [Deltaproteobacteria bacterium RIFCSPHIGHO2_02_FULL_42_44]OGQ38128.1 MAG: hypothetical protein
METIEPHAAFMQINMARIMVSSVDAKNRQMAFILLKPIIFANKDYVNNYRCSEKNQCVYFRTYTNN